jgi:hypothetical protein
MDMPSGQPVNTEQKKTTSCKLKVCRCTNRNRHACTACIRHEHSAALMGLCAMTAMGLLPSAKNSSLKVKVQD